MAAAAAPARGRPPEFQTGSYAMSAFERIRKRADFLRAAKGRRWNGEYFQLQISERTPQDGNPPRFGFTVTNKVGIAPVRNRIRRRLRAAVREVAPQAARQGYDYVLIGRRGAVKAPFARIVRDLAKGLGAHSARNESGAKRATDK
jgi:ribonuclease P protein component